MFDKLPDFIDPIAAVNHNKRFSGRVNQAKLPRLVEAVAEAEGDVLVDLKFYYDKAVKFPAFELIIEAPLRLECQRSLEIYMFDAKTSVKGVFTESMALVDDLPKEYEVYELDPDEDRISLLSMVEEELLLTIPMIPVNENANWVAPINDDAQIEQQLKEDFNEVDSKPNPFAALQTLKK